MIGLFHAPLTAATFQKLQIVDNWWSASGFVLLCILRTPFNREYYAHISFAAYFQNLPRMAWLAPRKHTTPCSI